MQLTPAPTKSVVRPGAFGELTETVTLEKPHTTLVVEANSRVDVHRRPTPEPASTPPWEGVRDAVLEVEGLETDSPALYLFPTQRTPLTAEITAYARSSFPPGRPGFAKPC